MYLALIPDAESLAALRRFVPTIPADAHLTVIHSGADSRPLPFPTWTGELTLDAQGVRLFGGRIKEPVLVLDDAYVPIRSIRKQAEDILRAADSASNEIIVHAISQNIQAHIDDHRNLRDKIAYELGLPSPDPADCRQGLSQAGQLLRLLAQPKHGAALVDLARAKVDEMIAPRQPRADRKEAPKS